MNRSYTPLLLFFIFLLPGFSCIASDDDILKDFDKVKKEVNNWNACINKRQLDQLKALYADSVQYYLNKIPAASCIASKEKWLKNNPAYQQQIKRLRIYAPEQDTLHLVAEFEKTYQDKGTKTVTALLYFRLSNGKWKITKESDLISEVAAIKKQAPVSLPKGEHDFSRDIWEDARDANLANNTVPFHFTLELKVGSTISGSYSRYSGYMREVETYTVKTGKITEGILEVTMIWDKYPSKKETLHFKIVDRNTLVNIDKEQELYGQVLSRFKKD